MSPELPWGVVFDGDDTLWITEPLYDQARDACREIVARNGIDGRLWEAEQRRIDLENVQKFGYSPKRFPTSSVQAYEEVCIASGRAVIPSVSAQVQIAAQSVFERTPDVVPGAPAVLARLKEGGALLALLTKGDQQVQESRVRSTGLSEYFSIVRIVADKTPQHFVEIAAALGVALNRCWAVGNSVRSDILPASKACLQPVWIEAHVWEHERLDDELLDPGVRVLPDLRDLPEMLLAQVASSR